MNLQVTVSGTHTVTWHDQSPSFEEGNREGHDGRGTQTVTISSGGPIPFGATVLEDFAPGLTLDRLSMTPAKAPVVLEGRGPRQGT
jgi:hypothetical protein